MIAALRNRIDHFFGRGEASITVPVMDGALKPNEALDAMEPAFELAGVDNLTAGPGGALWASQGSDLLRLDGGTPVTQARFSSPISALAVSDAGRLAVGLTGGRVLLLSDPKGKPEAEVAASCPTALLFLAEDKLAIANGSDRNPADKWQRDLMSGGRSGSLILWTPAETRTIAGGLAWPAGLALDREHQLVVSEAWAHRLLRVDPEWGKIDNVPLDRLPAYPGRIVGAVDGGFWLACFAPRNQLVEFVLKEPEYRSRMMATMDEQFWVAPNLRSGRDFREALQGGGVKQMGVLKPWAPTLSYGLVVRLSPELAPEASLHSRANGAVHGITSLAALPGKLWVGAKGDGKILAIETAEA